MLPSMWCTTPLSIRSITGAWQGKDALGNHIRSLAPISAAASSICRPTDRRCAGDGACEIVMPSFRPHARAPLAAWRRACRHLSGSRRCRWRSAARLAAGGAKGADAREGNLLGAVGTSGTRRPTAFSASSDETLMKSEPSTHRCSPWRWRPWAGRRPAARAWATSFSARLTTGGSIIFEPRLTTPRPLRCASSKAETIRSALSISASLGAKALVDHRDLSRVYAAHALEAEGASRSAQRRRPSTSSTSP
jgi:hypothetical protein